MKILVSTGALIGRPNGRNINLLEEYLPQLDYDGIEFMFYSDWYENYREKADFLNSLNIDIPVLHCQKTIGELVTQQKTDEALYKFEINAETAARIGASKMVMHLWNGEISDSNFDATLRTYPKLREIAISYSVDLLIENVLCNVLTPLRRWEDIHREYPDAHFIFDTKMAKFHDEYKTLFEPRCEWLFKENLIKHYHVNDYGGGYMTWDRLKVLPVGAGNIDFEPFFEKIAEIGYDDTMTVEATAFNSEGKVDFDMLNRCYSDIRSMLK